VVQPAMSRGLSLADFFTSNAGLHDEIKTTDLDEHSNPKGRTFDLGHENAFNMFSVILFNFRVNDKQKGADPSTLWVETKAALSSKGFSVVEAKSEKEFLDDLHNHDEAWFISSHHDPADSKRFVSELAKFHADGKGICVWVDNDPFFVEANLVLKDLIGVTVSGNTPGGKILKVGDSAKNGQFARHLITTGIVNLHEGATICYPSKVTSEMKVIGMSSNGHPCMFYTEPGLKAGPIVVDCGFTKLYTDYWKKTAGTERYVRNVAVWLLALDYRLKVGANWKGPIDTEKKEMEVDDEDEGKEEETQKSSED